MDIFHVDIVTIVKSVGYTGLFLMIFAESGIFFLFFLPGGSLLFTAGLLASQGLFNIWILIPTLALAAVLGDSLGYWFGKKVGPKIFTKKDSLFFKKRHLDQTEEFYKKYGPRAVVFGRFVPIVRTFAPILAGVASMKYRTFLHYNIIGALLWAVGIALLGYGLGTKVPNIEQYIVPIILFIIFLSIVPILFELFKKRKIL